MTVDAKLDLALPADETPKSSAFPPVEYGDSLPRPQSPRSTAMRHQRTLGYNREADIQLGSLRYQSRAIVEFVHGHQGKQVRTLPAASAGAVQGKNVERGAAG